MALMISRYSLGWMQTILLILVAVGLITNTRSGTSSTVVVSGNAQHSIRGIEEEINGNKINDDLPIFRRYANIEEPITSKDLAVFWHLPKAGGSSVKDIIGSCHHKVMSSEVGIRNNHQDDTEIAVVFIDGSPFVNTDTTTLAGLKRAKQLNLGQSELADVIVVQHLYEAESLFDDEHRGRLFAMFRHPIDRALSMFYYLQYANWEEHYHPDFSKMSLEEYGNSSFVENNFMVRSLTNKKYEEVLPHDLVRAMAIVKRKFIIGLLDKFEESFARFEQYFGWKYTENPMNQEQCRARYMEHGANKNKKQEESIHPGMPAYEALARQNKYDIELYEYIVKLFQEQQNTMFTNNISSEDYRLAGATCCECDDPPTC